MSMVLWLNFMEVCYVSFTKENQGLQRPLKNDRRKYESLDLFREVWVLY